MSRLLERWKRERAEKEARRLERERQKKEREKARAKEKKRLASERRKRRKTRMRVRKFYKKKRAAELKRRKEAGDVRGFYMILLMKNNHKIKNIGRAWWLSSAMDIYNNAVKENHETVKFPVDIFETGEGKQKQMRSQKAKYEIIVVSKIYDDEESNVSHFRDENGKFVEYSIKDADYKIIARDDWYIEETFNVYGYHPFKDRKNFDFILNEIVLKKGEYDDIKQIIILNNRLIVYTDSDMDIVTCKTSKEAERLHDVLQKTCEGMDNLVFMGKLRKRSPRGAWILDEMEKKTGWDRQSCKRIHTL